MCWAVLGFYRELGQLLAVLQGKEKPPRGKPQGFSVYVCLVLNGYLFPVFPRNLCLPVFQAVNVSDPIG